MKYFALLPPLFSAFALAAPPIDPSIRPQGSMNPQTNETDTSPLPQPKPGQTVEDFVKVYFPNPVSQGQDEEEEPALTKRNYSNPNGIATSKWRNNTSKEDYRFEVDLSPCKGGLDFSTKVGMFTTANGITSNVTLHDILDNVWSNRISRRQAVNTKWAAQLLQVAKLALQEANELLGLLICNASVPHPTSAAVYPYLDPEIGVGGVGTQLRTLKQSGQAYWIASLFWAGGGGLSFAGLAAGMQYATNVNITNTNVIQTGLVVGGTIMIGAIINRCWAVGRLDNPAQNIAGAVVVPVQAAANAVPNPQQMLRQVAPQAHEAMVQNVYLAWFRDLVRKIKQQVVGAVTYVAIGSGNNAAGDGGGDPNNPANNPVGNPGGTADTDSNPGSNPDWQSTLSGSSIDYQSVISELDMCVTPQLLLGQHSECQISL